VLDDVVAELVVGQVRDLGQDLIQDRSRLAISTMLEDPLDDPTAVGVDAEVDDVLLDGRHYKFQGLWGHLLYALLDHMVPILVIDAGKDLVLQLRDQELLLGQGDHFQGLLDHSASIH